MIRVKQFSSKPGFEPGTTYLEAIFNKNSGKGTDQKPQYCTQRDRHIPKPHMSEVFSACSSFTSTLQENMLHYNINTTSAATFPVYTTKA